MSPLSAGIINSDPEPAGPPVTAQYPFDDNSDPSVAVDTGPSGYNGNITGGTYVSHNDGYALSFDGIDDNMVVPTALHSPDAGTIDMIVNIPSVASSNAESIYLESSDLSSNADGLGPNGQDFNILAVDSNIRIVYEGGEVAVDNGGGIKVEAPAAIGSFERYTFVWDNGNRVAIYIGGSDTPATETSISTYPMEPFGSETILGEAFNGVRRFTGDIDSLTVYPDVLTPAEIDSA